LKIEEDMILFRSRKLPTCKKNTCADPFGSTRRVAANFFSSQVVKGP